MPDKQAGEPKATRWFTTILLVTVLTMAVVSGTRTLISYRVLAMGGDAIVIGIVTSLFALIPLLVAIPVGRAVDRGRGRFMLRIGSVVITLALVLTTISQNLLVLALGNAILGIGQILATVAAQGLIPVWSDPRDYDRRFGNLALAVSAGQLLGFPIAGAFAVADTEAQSTSVSTGVALAVMTLIAAAAVPFTFALKNRGSVVLSRKAHAVQRQSSMALLAVPGMKPAIYSSLLLLTSTDILATYLPVLGEELGLSVTVVTALLTARTVASLLSRATLTHLLRLLGRRRLLIGSTFFAAIPIILLPFLPLPLLLGVLTFTFGFFFGVGQPLTMSWVASLAYESNRGASLAVRLAGNRIGQVALPLGAGAVAGVAGTSAIFVFMGALLLSSTVATVRTLRREPS